MKTKFNTKFIDEVQKHIPPHESVVDYLMDILFLGREAVYRRIRGNVPFTLNEIIIISQKCMISIDRIIGIIDAENTNQVISSQSAVNTSYLIEAYHQRLKEILQIIHKTKTSKKSKLLCGINSSPYSLTLSYENLSRLRLYKHAYQIQNEELNFSFSKIELSHEIKELQKQIVTELKYITTIHLIIEDNLFAPIVKDIDYFVNQQLITKEELQILKKELTNAIKDLEYLSISGTSNPNNETWMYLSHVNFETSYFYFKSEDYSRIFIPTCFSEYHIHSNPLVCLRQEKWIESLKKYCTLITQCAEKQRFNFFTKQKELIMKL